jgi:hypothetical protein
MVGAPCCRGHWPQTWRKVYKYLKEKGSERDWDEQAIVRWCVDQFIIEEHESGIEIIAYLSLSTAIIALATSIVNLITTLSKAFSKESRERGESKSITLYIRYIHDEWVIEEPALRIDIHHAKAAIKGLEYVIENSSKRALHRASPISPTCFRLIAPFANAVSVAGSFSDWQPHRMENDLMNDCWIIRLALPKGKHLYKFIVDEKWKVDPHNNDIEIDDIGNLNSVLYIV